MVYFRFIPLIVLSFFTLKFLISYIEKTTINLNNKAIKRQIELGLLSIKDIQRNNYSTFLKIINILGCKEIVALPGGNSDLTNFKCTLNNTDILICCIQNDLIGETAKDEDKWESTGRPDVQSFLARMVLNDCKKGIIITNSTFSSNAIEFANNLNDQNRGIEIKLIDGYELTKSIRNHKYYIIKEGLINEVKYNI